MFKHLSTTKARKSTTELEVGKQLALYPLPYVLPVTCIRSFLVLRPAFHVLVCALDCTHEDGYLWHAGLHPRGWTSVACWTAPTRMDICGTLCFVTQAGSGIWVFFKDSVECGSKLFGPGFAAWNTSVEAFISFCLHFSRTDCLRLFLFF